MKWVETDKQKPPYNEAVLVHCKLYGRYLATYECIGSFGGDDYGNWRDFKGEIGVLPPTHWCYIPDSPELEELTKK